MSSGMARQDSLAPQKGIDMLQVLSDSWPGRSKQLEQLLALVGDGRVAAPPILIHGGPSTGKTTIGR